MAAAVLAMPHMGVSVADGVVLEWKVSEGDRVRKDDVVCEVATDKVDTEVVAPYDAVVGKILVAAGETVDVGAPLAELVSDAAEPPPGGEPPPAAGPPPAAEPAARVLASPVARRIAGEHGVALDGVSGSGVNGRIRKADVEAAVAARPSPAAAAAADSAPASEAGDLPAGYAGVPHEIVPASHQRRAIAEHMVRSRRTAAHMTTEVEVDMHQVARVRRQLNERLLPEGRPKLSYLPFVARAACAALAEYPDLNASFDGERLIRWRTLNIGIAVDTEKGLLAPVVRHCETLNATGIAERIADLARRAREGGLGADDMRGGTFTISNPGSVGAVSAMAIVNQPQVAILGIPRIVRRPTVVVGEDGEELVGIRPILLLALTFDHRAVDGAYATRAAVAVKERLEGWAEGDYA